MAEVEEQESKKGKSAEEEKKTGHNKYRRDKPWDTPDIDHWKQEKWTPGQ
tara:strand:+ start:581 stop:730 length:150 start_codon:yes stop_codon:yes gene_type:complete